MELGLELEDTVDFMTSMDYKDRFIAEYWQIRVRYERLKELCTVIEASMMSDNVEEPKHDCDIELLQHQLEVMEEYLHILEIRAEIEDVDIDEIFDKVDGDEFECDDDNVEAPSVDFNDDNYRLKDRTNTFNHKK